MSKTLNENTLTEQPVIDWLKGLGYDYEFGPDLAPGGALQERNSFQEVLLLPRLKRSLKRLNPDLPDKALDEAIAELKSVGHPSLVMANRDTYKLLTQGITIDVENETGERRGKIVKVFDFKNPLNNEFLVVNQFAIQGLECVRRPDIVVFINGIPIAIFEFKSPTSQRQDIRSAFDQLQLYKEEIPDLFKYNQVLVVGELSQARHGTISSPWEWFGVWKGVESEDEKNKGISELEILAQGLFAKGHLLDVVENFIVFEADSEKDASTYNKKMCMYHQYFGVNKAIAETERAAGPKGNKKIGVFWHTQGSGKSLSMVFYVNKVKTLAQLKSPTFVFLTDRNDLDGQLYKTFLRSGYDKIAKQADSIKNLKERLRAAGAELIFTTIQKFETEQELLSNQENIIVIADEAHRSQYAKFAGNVRAALPNASFMGITGTPISLRNKDTQIVFGKHISIYQINRAQEDGATVPIYYEGRLVPLHLANEFIDEEFEDLMAEHEFDAKESFKKKWARLEQAIGSANRLKQVADDIVNHFTNRGLQGKGMVVTMSRRIAVAMYNLITQMPNAPEVAVVISKTEEFKGQIQKELDNKELEKRFKNPDDPLKMVIVCDMWLTGFDVPCLHTMYIDKPLKNHTLMQAIARVNRIFKDKPGGLIVDYIGIADNIKKALAIYSSDIQKEAMIPIQEVIDKMLEKYDIVRTFFTGVDYASWVKLKGADLARLFQQAINTVITDAKTGRLDEARKKSFLKECELLSRLFALVMPHTEANKIRNDVYFFQAVKKHLTKLTIIDRGNIGKDIESVVNELVSRSIAAEGVVDIFDIAGKTKPDISIFDEKFLEEVKKMRFKNLAIDVLRKLLQDELRIRERKNIVRYQSLRAILEDLIEKYENNIINSTKVIERLLELAQEIKKVEAVGGNLGLSEEEVAFYDTIKESKKSQLKNGELKELVKELVHVIRRDITIDWTNNEVIKSRIRAHVNILLLRRQVPEKERRSIIEMILDQARALYQDFVPA